MTTDFIKFAFLLIDFFVFNFLEKVLGFTINYKYYKLFLKIIYIKY